MKHIIKLVFCLIAYVNLTSAIDGCHNALLDGCFCGLNYVDKKAFFVVNCTNTNFKSVEMLRVLPNDTEMLIFTGNNLPILPWNIFGDLQNLTKLKYIDMSSNRIKEIKGKTYHHVPNVETLILNHNELKISDDGDENFHHPRVFSNFINLQSLHLTNAFVDNTDSALADDLRDIFINSNLTKLFKLHLEQNEIKSFGEPKVFCDLVSLSQLYLANNALSSININLQCLKKLTFLDLENNNLTKLTTKDFDAFDQLAPSHRTNIQQFMIDISNNPFKCDSASNIYDWIKHTNVTIRNKDLLQCFYKKQGVRHLVNLKTLMENKHSRVSKAVIVLLIILMLILIVLISAYIYLSKEKIRIQIGPIVDKVTRKVQYTTIESQDV